jgi:hypothetical protein
MPRISPKPNPRQPTEIYLHCKNVKIHYQFTEEYQIPINMNKKLSYLNFKY